jgi:hypothetical protein
MLNFFVQPYTRHEGQPRGHGFRLFCGAAGSREVVVEMDANSTAAELIGRLQEVGQLARDRPCTDWVVIDVKTGDRLFAAAALSDSGLRCGSYVYLKRLETSAASEDRDQESTTGACDSDALLAAAGGVSYQP